MAYQELIKNFNGIRSYMREFYVYGFKRREEYEERSARSYDNERRRVESWLGDYMSFRQDASGKNVFLSVDSRHIPRNPLYKAFKARSFTRKDITLHFYILDILADGQALSAGQITDKIHRDYLSRFDGSFALDESTVRKKLQEYAALGLLGQKKEGRATLFFRSDSPAPDLAAWAEALAFFSEENPLGVIGSFLLDRLGQQPDLFRFKHHYILHALDSDILCDLALAVSEHRTVELTLRHLRGGRDYRRTVCPLKIYISTQTGRQYLLGRHSKSGRLLFLRVDAILQIHTEKTEENFQQYLEEYQAQKEHIWGVSSHSDGHLDRIELTLRHRPEEGFIPQRLLREKRCGQVEILDSQTCRFTAEVCDAVELLPWLRTFIGRIVQLKCSDPAVEEMFRQDLARMQALYGGDADAVQ